MHCNSVKGTEGGSDAKDAEGGNDAKDAEGGRAESQKERKLQGANGKKPRI